MSQLVPDAVNVTPPGSGGTIAVPSAASTTAGVGDLSAYRGKWLMVKASAKTHVRFGPAYSAAGTAHIYLTADADYSFRIPRDGSRDHLSARGAGGAGTLYYRVTSGPM